MRQTQQFPSPLIEQELVKMENEWARAWQLPDPGALENIVADDFTLTSSRSKGETTNKRQYIDSTLKLVRGDGFSFERMNVRIYGDTAVINAQFQQTATFAGQDWSGEFLITDIWVKRDGRWQVVARHASRPAA
ncbi:MAG TPA: nuclear transport factor 2 family protein [Thermoanaerobaculia bacterium]|nr:nuclear transport factor 2 family protein [Thermoanaerobaculia bacterium]